jgi:hypothetical protein
MDARDLPVLRDALRGYRDWRKAAGLEPSDWWTEHVREALIREGIVKPKAHPEASRQAEAPPQVGP